MGAELQMPRQPASPVRLNGVRELRASEAPELVEIGIRLHQKSAYSDYPLSVADVFKGVMNLIHSQHAKMLVYIKRGRIVGYLGIMIQPYWWASPYHGPRFACDRHFFASSGDVLSALVKAGVEWAFSKPRVVDITLGVASGIGTEALCDALENAGMERLGRFYWNQRSWIDATMKREVSS